MSKKFTDWQQVMMHYIVERSNKSSGMFLQQDYISDFVVVEDDGTFSYYDDMILGLTRDHIFKDKPHYYQLSLGVGECRMNSFNTTRIIENDRAYIADNSHPTLRRYKGSVKVAEAHIPEGRDSHYFAKEAAYFTGLAK
mmetsp:Transcript_22365/g.16852  ORF Transcript_22365/g.16852 Transcript_22365/m.16852 type:complete len:139 (+) Transcript_22365:1169-1585(+)